MSESPAPGIYEAMPEADYRNADATAKSDMDRWINPDKKFGREVIIGSAPHVMVLEGRDAYHDQYVVSDDDFKLNTKEGKAKQASLHDASNGKMPLKSREHHQVSQMYEALYSHPDAVKLLEAPGQIEAAVFGRFKGTEMLCKAKIDKVLGKSLLDLKTTHEPHRAEFMASMIEFGYANQAAWYQSLYAAVTDTQLPFVFLCVSKSTLDVWVQIVTWEQIAFGRKWRSDIIKLYERETQREDK